MANPDPEPSGKNMRIWILSCFLVLRSLLFCKVDKICFALFIVPDPFSNWLNPNHWDCFWYIYISIEDIFSPSRTIVTSLFCCNYLKLILFILYINSFLFVSLCFLSIILFFPFLETKNIYLHLKNNLSMSVRLLLLFIPC